MNQNEYVNAEEEKKQLLKFIESFCITATLQGRIAYFLMSVHAVNPFIFKTITKYDPKKILFVNMIYGTAVMLYYRPSMIAISKFNRAVFSILGSLMFNHSSMFVFEWMVANWSHRPFLVTVLGVLGGRIMMLHLLAYLYHVDSRYRGYYIRPYAEYESMYRHNN